MMCARYRRAGGVYATLSIGVGREAAEFEALYKNAGLALEMALSRGGDQAVVKDQMNFEFYGGRAKATEKRTKVKSRVMANALGDLMDDTEHVYVMGHKYADMDTLGAAAGICAIARKRGKAARIVLDMENNSVGPMLRKLRALPEYKDVFIGGGDAFYGCSRTHSWWWWTPTARRAWSPSHCWKAATGWRLSTTTAGAAATLRKWP